MHAPSFAARLYTALFAFLIIAGTCQAQKVWTLRESIDHALNNNLNIRQSALTSEQAEAQVLRSKAALAPSLNANASHQYNFGRSVDPFSYTFTNEEIRSSNVSLSGNLTIFNGFQLQNTLKQSKLDYLASQHDLKKIQNDISLNVVSAYLQVLYAREQLKVTAARMEESAQQRDRTRQLVDAGVMTRGNLLDAEAQFTNEELNQVTAENQLAIAKLTLIQLLELDSVNDIIVEDPQAQNPEVSILSQTPNEIFNSSLTFLPEVKSADTRVESAEKSLSLAKGGVYPSLTVFGGLSTGYSSARQSLKGTTYGGLLPSGYVTQGGDVVLAPVFFSTFERTPFWDQLDQNYSKNFGFNLSIPIFNGLSTHTGIRRANLGLESARVSAELTRNQVFKSIQQAHTDALAAQKRLAANTKAVESFQEAYAYAEKRYNAGLTSSLEFLTATNNLTRARIDHLQSLYDLIFRVKVLDFYAGRPLAF
jgi:outer membrane protein